MNPLLHKAVDDLAILERMKGADSAEATEFRELLEEILEKAEKMGRRGLFSGLRAREPDPLKEALTPKAEHLPAVVPPTAEHPSQSEVHPLDPKAGLDLGGVPSVPETAKPSFLQSVLNRPVSRRSFNQRTAAVAARMAAHRIMPKLPSLSAPTSAQAPAEDPIANARKLVSDFLDSTNEFDMVHNIVPAHAKKLSDAFRLHPDYEQTEDEHPKYEWQDHVETFRHKEGEHNVTLFHGKDRPAVPPTNYRQGAPPTPARTTGKVDEYIHRVDEHPEYDQALTERAHSVWNAHHRGEEVDLPGHEGSSAIRQGDYLLNEDPHAPNETATAEGDPIEPHKLYEHDWNDTGEIYPLENVHQVKDTLHHQMRGGVMKKGEDIREWMNQPTRYST